MTDVCNYSLTYKVNGHLNHMSPDDHYQDLKRIISAATGKAHRINVIMPFLYESRQHKRTKRESLDCALALEELNAMGVTNIITFDAHDPRVQNAIPLSGFDSFNPPYQFMKALFHAVPDIVPDKDHLMIISPDEGAMHRAVYLSNVLGVDMGMFYKRRDYSKIVNGRNPLVAHEFLGDDVSGKDVIIMDDMISSGESMLDVARQLKDRRAARVFVCTTFGLFTDGFEKFDEYYEKGYINKVITTNLTYLPPELYQKPYFIEADMSKFLALIIDSLNHDVTIGAVLNPTDKITHCSTDIKTDSFPNLLQRRTPEQHFPLFSDVRLCILSEPSALISDLCSQKTEYGCISLFDCIRVFCKFQALCHDREKSVCDFFSVLLKKFRFLFIFIQIEEFEDQFLLTVLSLLMFPRQITAEFKNDIPDGIRDIFHDPVPA